MNVNVATQWMMISQRVIRTRRELLKVYSPGVQVPEVPGTCHTSSPRYLVPVPVNHPRLESLLMSPSGKMARRCPSVVMSVVLAAAAVLQVRLCNCRIHMFFFSNKLLKCCDIRLDIIHQSAHFQSSPLNYKLLQQSALEH